MRNLTLVQYPRVHRLAETTKEKGNQFQDCFAKTPPAWTSRPASAANCTTQQKIARKCCYDLFFKQGFFVRSLLVRQLWSEQRCDFMRLQTHGFWYEGQRE